ncbi:DUF421 domain-containing protein [Desulfuribacillus alkaliarsenatis]|uniref:YetF C-terminal domain-containing protein n=1 Tax=Desulfuribacillus alkaliarsenatis TaxID=766136 RepID=A0A1E5G3Z2_9FIRM|nr:DUF421 domain-containing protein [Desulfuribacillus alkaliarsenatis]OEF97389.1 hypothetical protein BHF68_04050 [Desulfuribacillus alkaliarsenatis]
MIDLHELGQAIINPIIVFFVLIILARLIGKKLIGQLTFFDFVSGITLGTIGGAFVTTEVEGNFVLLSAVVFSLMVMLIGYITLKNVTARKLLEGEPVIVVQNGKILEKNMSDNRYNEDELLMQLREKGVFDISEVEHAILEPYGRLSIIKKSEYRAVARKDLELPREYKGITTELIRDGRIQKLNLQGLNKNYEWLYNQLMEKGVTKVEDVFLATFSADGKLYIDLRDDKLKDVKRTEDDDSTGI